MSVARRHSYPSPVRALRAHRAARRQVAGRQAHADSWTRLPPVLDSANLEARLATRTLTHDTAPVCDPARMSYPSRVVRLRDARSARMVTCRTPRATHALTGR